MSPDPRENVLGRGQGRVSPLQLYVVYIARALDQEGNSGVASPLNVETKTDIRLMVEGFS